METQNRSIQVHKNADGSILISGNNNQITVNHGTQQVETKTPASLSIGPNLYKGLGAFQEQDACHFFGREKQRLRRTRRVR